MSWNKALLGNGLILWLLLRKNYTNSQKFVNSKMFNVFFKDVSFAHQECIYLMQDNIVKYFYYLK